MQAFAIGHPSSIKVGPTRIAIHLRELFPSLAWQRSLLAQLAPSLQPSSDRRALHGRLMSHRREVASDEEEDEEDFPSADEAGEEGEFSDSEADEPAPPPPASHGAPAPPAAGRAPIVQPPAT